EEPFKKEGRPEPPDALPTRREHVSDRAEIGIAFRIGLLPVIQICLLDILKQGTDGLACSFLPAGKRVQSPAHPWKHPVVPGDLAQLSGQLAQAVIQARVALVMGRRNRVNVVVEAKQRVARLLTKFLPPGDLFDSLD